VSMLTHGPFRPKVYETRPAATLVAPPATRLTLGHCGQSDHDTLILKYFESSIDLARVTRTTV